MAQAFSVRVFEGELTQLAAALLRMGGMAEQQLAASLDALERLDADLARQTIDADHRVDACEAAITARAVHFLAVRQPLAGDLRAVIGSLRLAADLERVADHATGIARRTCALATSERLRAIQSVPRLGRMVTSMVKDILDALAREDVELALDVWHEDGAVDALYASVSTELLSYMGEDPRLIGPCTHLLFAAKNLERVGDHATNMAEEIHYIVRGTRIGRNGHGEAPPLRPEPAPSFILPPSADNEEA